VCVVLSIILIDELLMNKNDKFIRFIHRKICIPNCVYLLSKYMKKQYKKGNEKKTEINARNMNKAKYLYFFELIDIIPLFKMITIDFNLFLTKITKFYN
jgi:hypothetical protein